MGEGEEEEENIDLWVCAKAMHQDKRHQTRLMATALKVSASYAHTHTIYLHQIHEKDEKEEDFLPLGSFLQRKDDNQFLSKSTCKKKVYSQQGNHRIQQKCSES